jgi:probable phosphoglycerate mutase
VIVYFTRHGESVENLADRGLQPHPENADRLSERGWEQARGLGERLRGEGIEAILASPLGRAQETASAIGDVLGLPFETDEDLFEVRQSDAYRAASPDYAGTGHISWMLTAPRDHAEPGAESFADIAARVTRVRERLEARIGTERILCVSHWGFIHFFLGATIFREDFSPAHLPALYRMSHINTGITIFEKRRDYVIEGIPFDGWALSTWNDRAHL